MLDKLIVEGPWGMHQQGHLMRLTRVSHARFSDTKTKQATTYINSPLTGAQIEVQYLVKPIAEREMATVRITIPVASALVGHNYFHDGLSALSWEILCTGQLVRMVLYAIGMTEAEMENYMLKAQAVFAELTWHTACESVKARQSLQNRTIEFMRAARDLSRHRSVEVADAEIRESKSGRALLVDLKSGDGARQYCKPEQLKSRRQTKLGKRCLIPDIAARLNGTMTELARHTRNELLVGEDTLASLGLQRPGLLKHPNRVQPLVEAVWRKLGFGSRNSEFDPSKVGAAALATLNSLEAGVELKLSGPTFSRHRTEILAANGPDIAMAGVDLSFNAGNTGYQLAFARRWKVPEEWLDLVVSDRTGPALLEELQRGLAYLRDGETPFDNPVLAKAWRARWDKFRADQRLGGPDESSVAA